MPEPQNSAVAFWKVLRQELRDVQASRGRRQINVVAKPGNLIGLSFSGGGIRSASFNLGVLQGLAQLKMLHCVDYLSTVSGGGYIGSWLAGWIHKLDAQGAASGMALVETALSPEETPNPQVTQTKPLQFLRRYSNYLTPETGLFSADTWTMIAIWLRNTFLNLLILMAVFAAVLLIPRWFVGCTAFVQEHPEAVILSIPLLLVALWIIGRNLRSFSPAYRDEPSARNRWYSKQGWIQTLVVIPVFLSAWLSSAWFSRVFLPVPANEPDLLKVCLEVVGAAGIFLIWVAFFGDLFRCFYQNSQQGKENNFWNRLGAVAVVIVVACISASVGAAVLWFIAHQLQELGNRNNLFHVMTWGPPSFVTVFALMVVLSIGLLGRNFPDERREFWSRLGAWCFIYNFAWILLFNISIYGPMFVAGLIGHVWIGPGVVTGWIGSTAAGIFAAKSRNTGKTLDDTGPPRQNPVVALVAKVAPSIFILGLLVLVSYGIHIIQLQFIDCPTSDSTVSKYFCQYSEITHRAMLPNATVLYDHYWELLTRCSSWSAFWACLICAAIAFVLSWRIDINEFSMHHFYKNRLVRAYLGARNNDERKPNRFTGFDAKDDLHLAALTSENNFSGPYPILNAALNLVHGKELAWQERKAESFVFTPRFCGFQVRGGRATHEAPAPANGAADSATSIESNAYRDTLSYAYPRASGKATRESGIHLGTAMAISGAAASPNMGAGTSASSAFLMTVFNVRLGWWLGNPRHKKKYQNGDPQIGLLYMLSELAANTSDERGYIYLSDGGHFENLGIYELVRRGCRYIIACDSEEDHEYKFGGLGNAIRKCRTDFGVEIDLDVDRIRRDPATKHSRSHCVVGQIRYPSGAVGTLVYLKASVTGDEPSDVLQYSASHEEFPHQSTSNQWFKESQFESYRKLGIHVALKTFDGFARNGPFLCNCSLHDGRPNGAVADREAFFTKLAEHWYAPSSATERSFTKHAIAMDALMERFRTDRNLEFLQVQIYPEWRRFMSAPPQGFTFPSLWTAPYHNGLPESEKERRAAFFFCNSLIQLMEDVYLDLNLDNEWEHPDNRGWMNLFRHWVGSGMFRVAWAINSSTFGARFQAFTANRLGLAPETLCVDTEVKPGDLNNLEQRFLREAALPRPTDRIQQLRIRVNDLYEKDKVVFEFNFGFAVLDDSGRLVYIRIQNHLRRMGLARRAIDLLVKDKLITEPRIESVGSLPDQSRPDEPRRIQVLVDNSFERFGKRRSSS